MKTIKKPLILLTSIFSLVLASSFTKMPGGDSYTIYLNDKMLLQHFVHSDKSLPHLQLGQASETDKVLIYYSHCGKQGTSRVITVRDKAGSTLKSYNFPDGNKIMSGMRFSINELNGIQKKSRENLFLYYASKELPEGRMLASVNMANNTLARK